jgi:hypothetical protein
MIIYPTALWSSSSFFFFYYKKKNTKQHPTKNTRDIFLEPRINFFEGRVEAIRLVLGKNERKHYFLPGFNCPEINAIEWRDNTVIIYRDIMITYQSGVDSTY